MEKFLFRVFSLVDRRVDQLEELRLVAEFLSLAQNWVRDLPSAVRQRGLEIVCSPEGEQTIRVWLKARPQLPLEFEGDALVQVWAHLDNATEGRRWRMRRRPVSGVEPEIMTETLGEVVPKCLDALLAELDKFGQGGKG